MRETILDGARYLLGECCNILNENGADYIIVGGWSPFLLNSDNYRHPGTKDVDVLFKKGFEKNQLTDVIQSFLDNGFFQSAKHPFQLLRSINIKGIDFVYNIDLLHPDDQEKNPELFVDHIDFPVMESEIVQIQYKGQTIRLPKSDIFFTDFYEKMSQEFILLNEEKMNIEFNLLDEAGLILSKLKSVLNEKRTRDAYDIYLALEYNRDYDLTIKKIKSLISTDESVEKSFVNFFTDENKNILQNNIIYWKKHLNQLEHHFNPTKIINKFQSDLDLIKV